MGTDGSRWPQSMGTDGSWSQPLVLISNDAPAQIE
jgi:hypothetical protein